MRLYKCCIDDTRGRLYGNHGFYSVWRSSENHSLESVEIKDFLTDSDNDHRFIFAVFDAINPCDVKLVELVGSFLKSSYTPSVAIVLNAPLLSKNKWNALNTSISNSFDAVVNVSKLFSSWAIQSEGISAVISGIFRPLDRTGQGVFGLDYYDVFRFIYNARTIFVGWGYMPIIDGAESLPDIMEAAKAALSMLSSQISDLRKIRRILFHAEVLDTRFNVCDIYDACEMIWSRMSEEDEDFTISVQLEMNRLDEHPFKPRVFILASPEEAVNGKLSDKDIDALLAAGDKSTVQR